jgi:hypothetical protein
MEMYNPKILDQKIQKLIEGQKLNTIIRVNVKNDGNGKNGFYLITIADYLDNKDFNWNNTCYSETYEGVNDLFQQDNENTVELLAIEENQILINKVFNYIKYNSQNNKINNYATCYRIFRDVVGVITTKQARKIINQLLSENKIKKIKLSEKSQWYYIVK